MKYDLANFLPEAACNTESETNEVYGRVVVIKDFIEHLIKHGTQSNYQFYRHVNFKRKNDKSLNPEFLVSKSTNKAINVRDINQLKSGDGNFDFNIWHDINGELSNAIALRNRFSGLPYPISTTFHCLSYQFLLHEWFFDILLKKPHSYDAIVCTSNAAQKAMFNQFNHVITQFKEAYGISLELRARTEVIPLGIDIDKFKPRNKLALRKRLALPLNAFIILWIGRISPVDKADLLPTLIVLKELIEDNPEEKIKLVLGGSGDMIFVDIIKTFIEDNNLSDNVIIKSIPPSARHLYHAAADVFVSPADNIQETFGITPIEAMACGVPQVVSDWNGYRDTVIHGETGFLIPTYLSDSADEICLKSGVYDEYDLLDHFEFAQTTAIDLVAYKKALQILLDQPELVKKMSISSRKRALKVYSWKSCIGQYEVLWSSQIEELNFIPKTISYQKHTHNIDVPNFFKSFQHYASNTIKDTTMIQFSERSIDKKANYYENMNNISSALIDDILSKSSEIEVISVGDLITQIVENRYEYSQVLKHIMWLIKYNFIQVCY